MNTKHTPGPWFVLTSRNRGEERGYFDIGDSDDEQRATVLCTRFGWPERADEMLANANLIAAAPQMLVALEKLTSNAEQSAFEDWLEQKCPSGDAESVHRQWKESSDFQAYVDEWRHALDAIEKATGASHVHDQ
ncbi:hypothetical protein LMG18090_04732 [Ralstonia mannitolilytica]|uniref:hypothetical protein n=1 Tax=Ralstonia mannitolilytica TaxID=105219 RepID=UPI0007B01CB9|nr:hypothetical protein [Ralstonia mannitolilytica]ANA34454.1 hypothetical protein VZ52_14210 [Ralstonia mannitolilytica]CAJ0805090.1 hypothetical protein LMG18090_04732 [Ralstonia mannitolilytica]